MQTRHSKQQCLWEDKWGVPICSNDKDMAPPSNIVLFGPFFSSTFEEIIMNVDIHTNYIHKLINGCMFSL